MNPLPPNQTRSSSRRRTKVLFLPALAFLIAISASLGRSTAAQEATPAPLTEAGVLEAAPSTLA
ncbi:MAG: hypothetical protein M3Q03_13185 [Chloroflexota bacterium]|nr:hypothetical protein [Chloroflexota bacterium]